MVTYIDDTDGLTGQEFNRNVIISNEHTYDEPNVKEFVDFEQPINIQSEMREYVESRSLHDNAIATVVSMKCLNHFSNKYTDKYFIMMIYNFF